MNVKLLVKIILNIAIFGGAIFFGYNKFEDYFNNPWTRNGQVRSQVIQVSPRVSGAVVDIAVVDNQQVKIGDLLFEVDPSEYKIRLAQAEADLKREHRINKYL